MMPSYVALTTLTERIRMEELACVAAALQIQVTRDFAPHWNACAVISAVRFEAIPAGYCPVIVQDALETDGACGFHRTEHDESPYILLPFGPTWSLAASHSVLSMLANPTGADRRSGPSHVTGQGTVDYLVDVCAPCQDIASAYAIDGVAVSDFCMPEFFAAPDRGRGPYSHTGAVRECLKPAPNGLLTWLADDGLLYQAFADAAGRIRVDGGFSLASRGRMTLRDLVEMVRPDRLKRLSGARPTQALATAERNAARARVANLGRYGEDIAWRFGQRGTPSRWPVPDGDVAGADRRASVSGSDGVAGIRSRLVKGPSLHKDFSSSWRVD
jgi:hypothetical protein